MSSGQDSAKILHFLPRWTNGGMEHAVLGIVDHFKDKAFSHEICTVFKESDYGLAILRRKGIRFSVCSSRGHYSFYICLESLIRKLKSEKVDILHCHINNAIGLTFAFVARMMGVKKVVVHTHNNAFGSGNIIVKRILRSICIMFFAQIPDLYLACSNEAGKWTFGKNIEKNNAYHVVYNGIDLKAFTFNLAARRALREKYSLSEKYVIGHIGHFNYQKNQTFLLKTIKSTLRQIPNAHYFFIGTGEMKEGFLKEIGDLGVNDYVTVIDVVENPQDYYSMFDLFAFPSHFEGFGIVMIEAQMSGLPIVCSEYVPRETDITHHVRYLPIDTEESVDKWTESIVKWSRQEKRINRMKIPACNKYDISDISAEIEGYYLKMMEKE